MSSSSSLLVEDKESREDVEQRHRKELKNWEGEKRAALKKTKATAGKGKKGKDAVAAYVVILCVCVCVCVFFS